MMFLYRRVLLQWLCCSLLSLIAGADAFPRNHRIERRRHQPAVNNGLKTYLKAVPVLDEWKVMPDGRVQGKVSDHPDPDIEDGAIISTSALKEPKCLSGDSINIIVKTYSGSQYQLLSPIKSDVPSKLGENTPAGSNGNGSIPEHGRNEEHISGTKKLMMQVKDAGVAGIISYAFWELGFWTVSVPLCIFAYRQVTGHWPDFASQDDLQSLGAEAFAFVNFARFAVPLRIGLALGTTPWIQKNIVDRFTLATSAAEGTHL